MIKMNVKEVLNRIKRDTGFSISKMSLLIGFKDMRSLYRKRDAGKVTVDELRKCVECSGEKLVIVYKGEKIQID